MEGTVSRDMLFRSMALKENYSLLVEVGLAQEADVTGKHALRRQRKLCGCGWERIVSLRGDL